MTEHPPVRPAWITGLSARLLALTIVFVMLAEVLIFVPSIARYRKVHLEDHIAKAHLAIKALEATPDNMVSPALEQDLLRHAGAYAVSSRSRDRRTLMLGPEPPPPVDLTLDLRSTMFPGWIMDAFDTLVQRHNRILRVIDASPREPDVTIEVIIDETPMRQAMVDYSARILTLSIIISLITAGLVYFSLHWLMVRPILSITDRMVRFGEAPEDDAAAMPPTVRGDEIGIAQRELARIQRELTSALRQKTRLAALGSAVTKINHDLRNVLASAMLQSDRLAANADPEVARQARRMMEAIDRAVALCSSTLNFVNMERPLLHLSTFAAADLLDEVAAAAGGESRSSTGPAPAPAPTTSPAPAPPATTVEADGVVLTADREQMFRALSNLVLNAVHAGCSRLTLTARACDGTAVIDVTDNGPGIPDRVRPSLFKPFSGRAGGSGSGLGLVIASEIVTAHRGQLTLISTGGDGTTFRVTLPA